MKILLISVVVALGVGAIFQRSTNFSEQANAAQSGSQQAIASTSQAQRNVEVMLRLFRAVESHDEQSVFNLYQPDVEFCWPPSLPYGGSGRGRGADKPSWGETWALLQPTDKERKMDPRVVAASDDEVVVLWHQRGISSSKQQFEDEVLGLYRLRDGKLARAQMFYFDTTAAAKFLDTALSPETRRKQQALLSRVRSLAPDRQLTVIKTYWKLQAMPVQRWQEELKANQHAGTFSPEELQLLNDWLRLGTESTD
jgi:ketosteroid isomerase-like protein